MVERVTATLGSSGLQPKIEPAINFSITLAALLPQKVHLVATLNCCDVIRQTHSWLTAQRGILSQQLGMAHATRIKLIDLEREHILNTLRQCRGNRTHTAR